MASRKPLAVGADGHPQTFQSPDVVQLPTYTVAQLKAMTGVTPGAMAFATDGRAIAGVSVLGLSGLLVQASPGGGCLVTADSAGTWKVAGTTVSVSS